MPHALLTIHSGIMRTLPACATSQRPIVLLRQVPPRRAK